jgi:hypothetical protein
MPENFNPILYSPERWRPSIFMPRIAARIFLRVTAVRVERLQDISNSDIRAEGIKVFAYTPDNFPYGKYSTETVKHIRNDSGIFDDNSIWYREWYSELWDSINGKRNGGAYKWDNNCWVWVISFERIGDYK